MYLLGYKPYEKSLQNNNEIFNELCILLTNYHLFAFTDFVEDPELQFLLGWSVIGILFFNIFINFGIMMKESLKMLILKIKKKRN